MKRFMKISLFIALQCCLVFIYIYQQSNWIKLSYLKQNQDNELKSLKKTKQELLHQLHTLASNKSAIKKFALNELKMRKMKISQIRKISYD
ncbi:hypothetical protein Noda2021_01870 [Candidatus Dependentiae bacterium Noda2021]|nr:hypothetical protein Noda2021_01870 [Candidatus Dependentiae bacterium Noda2021]